MSERIAAGDLTDLDIREAISDLETDLAILEAALKIKTGRLGPRRPERNPAQGHHAAMTCHPEWRCLRIGCPRCDLQRRRDAERKRLLREFVDAHNIARRFRDPTIEERRREREALRRAAEQELERREGDPSVN